ncbi:hypothetical protein [Massilia sp. LC238]|uniref:hypothetical protein n=1 Tax=Massilia sp. LC238 TaxID=1502852 RepID=UPI0004E385BE|nr:hypothetical protein [Massilia sp. LC238]KFC72153.1 hypothetical protein FG94_02186 [Massilia sp. LC238]
MSCIKNCSLDRIIFRVSRRCLLAAFLAPPFPSSFCNQNDDKKSVIATLLALSLAVPAAFAQDGAGFPSVKISGFGTGALTYADTRHAEFARPNQAEGSARGFRTGIDSNLGLQADMPVNSWLSLTAQGLVRKDAEASYGAELT